MSRPFALARSAACALALVSACCAADPGGMDARARALHSDWSLYRNTFLQPGEIFYEVRAEARNADLKSALEKSAAHLRLFPQVQDAFAVWPEDGREREELTIYRLLNAPPAEFGAWLEKLRPADVRRELRSARGVPERRQDPLALRRFMTASNDSPFFRMRLPRGVFLRLRGDPESRPPAAWRQQAIFFESEVLGQMAESGLGRPLVLRRQTLPYEPPDNSPWRMAFWLAAASIGAVIYFFFFGDIVPYAIALGGLAAFQLVLRRLQEIYPRMMDPDLTTSAVALGLLVALLVHAEKRTQGGRSRRWGLHPLLFALAGGAAAWLFIRQDWKGAGQFSIFWLALPAVYAAAAFFRRLRPDAPKPMPRFGTLLLAWIQRRRPALCALLVGGLALFLFRPAGWWKFSKPPNPWAASPFQMPDPGTRFLLAYGPDSGEMIYELGAIRHATREAEKRGLISSSWTPASWVPRPAWQRSNAADFLRKRNVVVLEKIARQEGWDPAQFAPTLSFLNRVGEKCVPLVSEPGAAWHLPAERDALGLRARGWIRADSARHVAACMVESAGRPDDGLLLPWFEEALRGFGVPARWYSPELLEEFGLRERLRDIVSVTIVLCVLFLLSRAAEGNWRRLSTAALSTFFSLSGWILTLISAGLTWIDLEPWIWTTIGAFHLLLWMSPAGRGPAREADPMPAAALTASGILLAAASFWWLKFSSPQGAILTAGVFWSVAWWMLAPGGNEDNTASADAERLVQEGGT